MSEKINKADQATFEKLVNDGILIDNNNFSLPTSTDFNAGSLTPESLRSFGASMGATKSGDGAAFFIEQPYSLTPGYYPEAEVTVVRATPYVPGKCTIDMKNEAEQQDNLNGFDGDTIYFKLSTVDAGSDQDVTVGNQTYNSVKEYMIHNLNLSGTTLDNATFGLRILGINCPEVPHYSVIPNWNLTTRKKTLGEIKAEPKYIYDHSVKRADEEEILFVELGDDYDTTYNEVVDTEYMDSKTSAALAAEKKASKSGQVATMSFYKIVRTDDTSSEENALQGLAARKAMKYLIQNSEDMLLMLDHKSITRKSGQFPQKYSDSFFEEPWSVCLHPYAAIQRLWNGMSAPLGYYNLGFDAYGQDNYRRFLGSLYVKISMPGTGSSAVWVNAAKYLLETTEGILPLPDYTSNPLDKQHSSFSSDAFNLWSYSTASSKIVDSLAEISKGDFDDRRAIQKEIVGQDFDAIKDWTLMIGDCLFMVPPTSIRAVTQTTSERMPLLRSKGSMTKSNPKSERLIEMTLYFNEDEGINGSPYEVDIKGSVNNKVTYYMNGLRSLVSMFKFTPFLPVESHYINKVLNIEAVSLVNLQVGTMQGYPRCLAATLTLQEFNYHTYMPEIPIPDINEDGAYDENLFAKTIDFATMRWYYQRAIRSGEAMSDIYYTKGFNDKDYIGGTFGEKTALQPMKFDNAGVEFYVIRKDYLDQQLNLKIEAMNKALKTQNTVTDNMKTWAKQLAYLYRKVHSIESNSVCSKAFANFQKEESGAGLLLYKKDVALPQRKSSLFSNFPNSLLQSTRMYKGSVSREDLLLRYIDPIYSAIYDALGGFADGLKLREDVEFENDVATVTWNFIMDVPRDVISDQTELDNFLKIVAADMAGGQTGTITVDDLYKDGAITFSMTSSFIFSDGASRDYYKQDTNFSMDSTAPGMIFLAYCASKYGIFDAATAEDFEEISDDDWTGVASDVMQSDITAIKQSIDVETMESLQFEKYMLENLKITNISCVFGNTLSRLNLKMTDGYAPQYCGGQDTVIEVSMQTQDESSVQMINLLPRIAAQYARDYRLVLSCWPLRMDSEITRFLGINEVLVESVDITTVQGQPGLFNINMRLTSVDRTARNKEALRKLDIASNAGSKTATNTNTVVTKNFFEMKETLAKTEIYPDLELPTVDELANAGIKFIRYANKAGTAFVDPDFYYVYAHSIASEIFKTTILDFLDKNAKTQTSFELNDNYGSSIKINPESKTAYTYDESSANPQAKALKDQRIAIIKAVDDVMKRYNEKENKVHPENLSENNIVNMYSSLTNFETWDISNTVRCMFRELKYDQVMDEDKDDYTALKDRSDKIVKMIDAFLAKPLECLETTEIDFFNKKSYIKKFVDNKQSDELDRDISNYLTGNSQSRSDFLKICSEFEIDLTNQDFIADMTKITKAAAAAASGECDYDGSSNAWKARMFINVDAIDTSNLPDLGNNSDGLASHLVPYCRVDAKGQGDAGKRLAINLREAISSGNAFGPFQTKCFTKEDIVKITGETINGYHKKLLLDPYYRKIQLAHGDDSAEIIKYKKSIMMDGEAATEAYIRTMLVWTKQLLEKGILLSMYEIIQTEGVAAIEESLKASGKSIVYPSSRAATLDGLTETSEAGDSGQTTADAVKATEDMTDEEKSAYNQAIKDEKEAIKAQEEENKILVKAIKDAITEGRTPLGLGKFFAASLMTLTAGNETIYDLMHQRNYSMLNQMVQSAQTPNANGSEDYMLRKFIFALVGYKMISSLEKIGQQGDTVSEMLGTIMSEKVYLEAAEDPNLYVRDSFYDMIMNDKRGRMARAFPTFYMMFIDEGREIGLWKLHDNFYNMSAISEIQVTKSRKLAADTARIVMSNMFQTYTTDDEDAREMSMDADVLQSYQYTWKDVFNSIFSPRTYYKKEELSRSEALPVEKSKLKPGVRVHLRMGYGSDASELPILFNGVVAEVGTGESIEIICQGDGVELVNPILSTSDAEDVQHEDDFVVGRIFENWLTKGATPRQILGSLLTTKGGWMKKTIYEVTNGRFFNQNPYGIVHFGDPQFTEIFQGSECVQNIYEASHKPSWDDEKLDSMLKKNYSTENVPKLSAHVFGKSYWDLMAICAGASPDFICSTAPFGFRSTIFYGLPRYYYAYDYVSENVADSKKSALKNQIYDLEQKKLKEEDMTLKASINLEIIKLKSDIEGIAIDSQSIIREKRKPFQQYHIYTSYSDIVANNITASSKEVKTCAIGLYSSQGVFGKENMSRVGPMWVDWDIYPEYQKTMTVDTQFVAKGVPVLGDIIPFLNTIGDKSGLYNQNGYEVAWRITARALKDSVKDMYQGELIVIGDPVVKPYDKMFIEDVYERMEGACEVEAVVQNFTVENGYTTSVFADCIANIDDRHEQVAISLANSVVAKSLAAYIPIVTMTTLFAHRSRPFLTAMAGYASRAGGMTAGMANSIAGLLGKDELINNEKLLGKMDSIKSMMGLNSINYRLAVFKSNLSSVDSLLSSLDKDSIKNMDDMIEQIQKMGKAKANLDPTKMIEDLTIEKSKVSADSKQSKILSEAIDELQEYRKTLSTQIGNVDMKSYKETYKKIVAEALKSNDKAVLDAAEELKNLTAKKTLSSADDITKLANSLKVINKNVDIDSFVTKGFLKTTETMINKIFTTNGGLVKVSKEVADKVKASKKLTKGAKLVATGAKAGFGAIAIGMAAEMAITLVITGCVYEYIERWMNNLQVLQIIPLKKDGKVMTAGMTGSKGLVVGSPTYNMEGTVQTWIGNVFADREGWFYNFMRDMLATEDMKETAARFRRNNDMRDPESTVEMENASTEIMARLAGDELKTNAGGYNSMLFVGRLTNLTDKKAEAAYIKYSIQDSKNVEVNPAVTDELICLSSSKELMNGMKNGHIKLFPEAKEKRMIVVIGGKPKSIPVVDRTSGKDKLPDIPFVRPDLYYVIDELYSRLKIKYEYGTSKYKKQFEEHQLVLQSALIAGDNSWGSTGFQARVSLTGEDIEPILKEMNGEAINEYFFYQKVAENTYNIMAYPPVDSQTV